MVAEDAKESKMRAEWFAALKLSEKNQKIAEAYLDMEHQENTKLLSGIKHQIFSPYRWYTMDAVSYLEWLRKKKRTEELERCVRFLAEVSGSTLWMVLIPDNNKANMKDLEKMLLFLKGEHAEEQKMAVRASWCCQALILGNPQEVKTLCKMGEEDPEICLRAMEYCYDNDCLDTWNIAGGRELAKLLLSAIYLYWKEPGTVPDKVAETLAQNLANTFVRRLEEEKHVFRHLELECIQEFVKNAGKDTPFPQNILSIYRKVPRGRLVNTVVFATCAFLALKHSLKFEIIFRLLTALDSLNEQAWKNISLRTAMSIVNETDFEARMDEVEDMLPLTDKDYILWCLQAGYHRGVMRMAMKSPEGIKETLKKVDSDEYRKLMELLQKANPRFCEELPYSCEEMFLEKISNELLRYVSKGKNEMKRYLFGECSIETLISSKDGWEFGIYYPEVYQRIDQLWKTGNVQMYRRAVVLEVLKGGSRFFEQYWVMADGGAGKEGSTNVGSSVDREGNVGEDSGIDREEGAGAGYGVGTCGKDSDKENADSQNGSKLYDKRQIRSILRIFEEEKLPCQLQISSLGCLADNIFYDKKSRALFLEPCAAVLKEYVDQNRESWEEAIIKELQGEGASARWLCLWLLGQYSGQEVEKFRQVLLSCAENGTEQIHQLLLNICQEHREWEEDILNMLVSKKQKTRAFAILVLEEWNSASYLAQIKTALEKEKNKKLAAQLQTLIEDLEKAGESLPEQSQSHEEKLAGEILKGARKRKVEWVKGMILPEVHRQDGTAVSQEYMLALLAAYADMETPGVCQEAKKLAEPLNTEELAAYVNSLYEGWLKEGAEAKKRWVLYAFSIHGGTKVVSVLQSQIKEWAEHSRGAIASDAVRALVLNGSTQALLVVDQMSRKFKFRQIRNAAGEALSNAASALGISREELEDSLVTDMGFDEQMEQIFDYGPRKFTVRLNTALELEVYDGNGKRLKNLPSPGKQDDPEKADSASNEFKQLKKQLKTMVSGQKLRLEEALSMARFWTPEKWKELFVKNPVMHQFAVGLVWGVYIDGVLKETFRYMDDGSFNSVDGDEFMFPEIENQESDPKETKTPKVEIEEAETLEGETREMKTSEGETEKAETPKDVSGKVMPIKDTCKKKVIGIVHPVELSKTELAAWKEQLSDYEIIQPFAQLERPVYEIEEEEKGESAVIRFDGESINGLSLSGKLLGQGWFRGEILDAGFFYNYYRNDGKFGAELVFTGSSVGYEDEEVTIRQLYFYHLEGRGHHGFGEGNRCRPEEVPPRYFSEVLMQVDRAAGRIPRV